MLMITIIFTSIEKVELTTTIIIKIRCLITSIIQDTNKDFLDLGLEIPTDKIARQTIIMKKV